MYFLLFYFDDDTDMTHEQMSHFVHIDFFIVIQEEDYKKAKQILEKSYE